MPRRRAATCAPSTTSASTSSRASSSACSGPNGAGKTTLISILAGLARATAGRVAVLGHDVDTDYAAARRSLGVVPQELVFDPFFSVREALRIQGGYFGVHDNDAWIDELLANLGLADKADANMRQLSGGMKRRVLVAQALVHRPPVIVLDEPTAGVDVELRQTLWQFVARLNKEGHTVLLTTHYLEEAEALCGRIAMLKQGRVVALDRTSALLAGTASTMLRFKLDRPLPPASWPRSRASPAASSRSRRTTRARSSRSSPCCTPPAASPKTWRSAAPTSRTCSSRSCTARRRRDASVRTPRQEEKGRQRSALGAGAAETGILAGTRTLLYKEVLRFWKVSFQTVAAPVLTAVLYLLIFGHVLEGRVTVFGSVGYTSFLIPGLVMMSVLQNAFANSSSSLIQSKITGNLVFLLVSPLSHWAWFLAYVGASVVRGVVVGAGVLLVTVWFAPLHVANPLWIVFFTLAGAALMGALGLIAGPVGREVRPDRRVPELHHHADDVPLRRVLFGRVAAAVLAGREPPESVLLHDRRLSPRLLRHQRRLAVDQPRGRRREPRVGLRVCLHLLKIGYKIRH